MTVVLTAKQIEDLATFAKEYCAPQYTITTATIPELEADDGEVIPEYTGLVVYSGSEDHGVLNWKTRHYSRHSLSACDNAMRFFGSEYATAHTEGLSRSRLSEHHNRPVWLL